MSEEKETPSETLSKSWVVVDTKKAEDDTATPAVSSGVENIPVMEKECNDSHVDSDTDSISIISESDGCSRNGKSDEEEVPEVIEAHGPVTTHQIVSNANVSEIEILTSDYLKEKWKVKQLSIALAVVISSVLLGYYVEMTSHAKSNYQFDIANDDNFRSYIPVRRFDPYKKYGIKDTELKREPPRGEKVKVKTGKSPEGPYKNDKEEELNIKEIYLSEKEKFLIQKEHELVKREMEIRQEENAYYKRTINEPRNEDEYDNYKNNMRKENPLKQEKEKRRDDKTRKQGHCPREENNVKQDYHDRYVDKKSRLKHEEDEKPEEDGVSGKWYMNLHQARNNLRNKMDYPFIKKMKNKALWYFRWMFARESNRSNKRKSKFEI